MNFILVDHFELLAYFDNIKNESQNYVNLEKYFLVDLEAFTYGKIKREHLKNKISIGMIKFW